MQESLRAVAACRCSTEEESQKDALVNQVKEAKACIASKGWILVDTYVEAKSGTTTKGRQEYKRLFQDISTNKFDVIVAKSQDRLMRNVKDWYLFVDELVKNHKQLFLYLENKFYSPDDALITGIKAILAEEYSRELSKKINNAHRNRQKEGRVLSITNATYGYKKLKDKSVVIDEDEREMIENIFTYAAEGYGTTVISQLLYKEGFRSHKGEAITPHVIRNIIKNPIYMGTAILNRKHFDFNTKKVVMNQESEWVIHKNAVPNIISEELFDKANEHLKQRSASIKVGSRPVSRNQYGLSGLIVCGLCGAKYNRVVRSTVKTKSLAEWKCSTYIRAGRNYPAKVERALGEQVIAGCNNVHLNEQKLYSMLESLYKKKEEFISNDDLLNTTMQILNKALKGDVDKELRNISSQRAKLIQRKDALLDKLLDGIITNEDYKSKQEQIENRICELDKKLQGKEDTIKDISAIKSRLKEIEAALKHNIIDNVRADDMIQNIKVIKVFPEKLEIYFDSFRSEDFKVDQEIVHEIEDAMKITVPNTCLSAVRPDIEKEKMEILDYLEKNPKSTVKNMAMSMNMPHSRILRRVNELKAEERLRYSTPNGKGHWIVSKMD